MIIRPHSILLDAEAFSALAADDPRMQPWATVARRTDSPLYASAATLAEITDGTGRDAAVRRAAKAIRLRPIDPDIGYIAGKLRAAAAAGRRKLRDLTIDAIVAATATTLPVPAVVLTSDLGDLELLLAGTAVRVVRI